MRLDKFLKVSRLIKRRSVVVYNSGKLARRAYHVCERLRQRMKPAMPVVFL